MLAEHTAHEIALFYYFIIVVIFLAFVAREIILNARIKELEAMLKDAQTPEPQLFIASEFAQPVESKSDDSNVISLVEWKDGGRDRRPMRKTS